MARNDIDPQREVIDPAKAKRPRRRHRSKPDPVWSVEQDRQRALERMEGRAASPGVMLEPEGEGHFRITSPHSDLALWELQIGDAFGTRSQSVVRTFMRDLKRLCGMDWDDKNGWKANETELNAALAMVADIRPENAIEAGLAAQMVAVHWMQMRLSQQALNRGGMVMERDAALASKMARTYVMQLEALRLQRGKSRTSRQTIKVKKETHQHVHYHDHRTPAVGEIGDQSDAPSAIGQLRAEGNGGTCTTGERPALSGPLQVVGEAVPLPRRKGPVGV